MAGWIFDLDGVIWAHTQVLPGAIELVEALRRKGRGVVFLTNNSGATAPALAERLTAMGIPAGPEDVVCPIDAAGEYLLDRCGKTAVLVSGLPELRAALERAGHVPVDDPEAAGAVIMGRDPAFGYATLARVCQAVDRGIPFLALNRDPRYPVGNGAWLPGLGAWVAAVVAAAGREPEIVGKPSPLLFEAALGRLGLPASATVMVGDTPAADIAGGLGAGLWTVLVGGDTHEPQGHLQVADTAALCSIYLGERGK